MIEKTIGKICASCSFSCFKEKCKRKNWQEKNFLLVPKIGKDKECPMLQFKAIKPKKEDYGIFEDLPISVKETIEICGKCKYVGESDTLDGLVAHCLDCPNHQIREVHEETMAEAMASL